jgi:exopolysaccharide biosynthesis predicted pyruvyltransferase EpsI
MQRHSGSTAPVQCGVQTDAGRDGVIRELGQIMDETLRSLLPAGEPCALLGFPDHPNVGDSAIWIGERLYLANRGVPVTYICSDLTYSENGLRARVAGGPILISGGGNLGDLWPDCEEQREAVIRAFPRNRIIQLPQSIWFNHSSNLARARAVFDSHPDLTILVRDQRSLEIARNEFRATSVICPDMAFALGPLQKPIAPDRDLVCLLRQDIESRRHSSASVELGAVPVDWVTDQPSMRLRLGRVLVEHHRRFPRVFDWSYPLLWSPYLRLWDGMAGERLRRGCKILSRGKLVVTDRLHGHILSLLLGIPHIVLDNSYGKLSSFYQTWTRVSALAHWAETPDEAAALAFEMIRKG